MHNWFISSFIKFKFTNNVYSDVKLVYFIFLTGTQYLPLEIQLLWLKPYIYLANT